MHFYTRPGERVGMPFPLLKSCRNNAWEQRSVVKSFKNAFWMALLTIFFQPRMQQDCMILHVQSQRFSGGDTPRPPQHDGWCICSRMGGASAAGWVVHLQQDGCGWCICSRMGGASAAGWVVHLQQDGWCICSRMGDASAAGWVMHLQQDGCGWCICSRMGGAWTQTPIAAWLASIHIVPVL